ncbi:glycoside hydrolase family 78 protein [Allokutzneria sp. A3M-2-11 16]|uniref:family 78 glycoside hydrolase catalytic domain n=1 Tax=Allokutzneria sp. A3M-2-11 16 TaxID=2962043 RepID=UPI0020B703C1|nr:family 78 glycoside hydrolase catalytic domain [Allokutzneria sp. A3M-2-11 16]MCP3804124.1 glycoside hydrolase family 78 protein [Allokutzneria sp. A3M-2-11 16]
MAEPRAVRIEHLTGSPVVVGTPEPRLSWQRPALEVELADASGQVRRHRLDGTDQVLVPWPFPPLPSRSHGSLRVRARDCGWSEPTTFETPLLHPEDWSARFIAPGTIGRIGDPAPLLSGRISLPGKVVRARLHMTSLGVHVASINGERVGDIQLDPGWTSYEHRLRYRTHDVTSLLRPGDNDIDVLLGNGWYRGRLGWQGKRAHYGDRLALLAQLEVTCVDGSQHVFGTDETWTARSSNVIADDLYDGQTTDLRECESTQDSVEVLDVDLRRLEAPIGPPVRAVATVPAVSVTVSPSGKLLVDFGENLVGWVRLRVHQGRTQITVRHAEVLEHGELGTRPLRSALATDRYLLPGDCAAICEPSLTFHGFRYAEIDGVDWLDPADVEAVVLSSDLPATGWFTCSEPDLNALHENVRRAMRGNFLDVPTDCPQRDERLGWTGDIQVFGPTAAFLADSAGFLTSWLRDLAADQYKNGCVPFVVPDVLREPAPSAAAWGDAATVVPWTLYQRYGDVRVLADQFASMRAWVDRQAALAGPDHIWSGGFQFGDWLDPAAPPDNPFAAKTDHDIVATAHFAYSASIVAKAAEVLGRQDEARNYGDLATVVREAFARAYATPSGRMVGDAPTAYAMALVWDLLPTAEQRAGASARLADLVRANGFRIATGFVGTPIIADALCLAGQSQVAYRLLLERGCPSWLYPVTMGATTIWERWDSMLPDGSINPGEMTSFNHYALGAVADWMHRTVAGLAPGAPGYRSLLVRPLLGGGLTHASARHETPYGRASVAWQRQDGTLTLAVEVPGGTTATVHVPGSDAPEEVEPGTHRWEVPDPVAAPSIRTIRDAVDDPRLWAELVAVAVELDVVADGPALGRALARDFDRPAADLPKILVSTLEHTNGQELGQRLAEALGSLR